MDTPDMTYERDSVFPRNLQTTLFIFLVQFQ